MPELITSRDLIPRAAGSNYLRQSNDFSQSGIWASLGNVSVTANATKAPDGTLTAAKIICVKSNNALRYIGQTPITPNTGGLWTISVYAKAAENFNMCFEVFGQYYGNPTFNLRNGTISNSSNPTMGMQYAGNGWYRCWYTYYATVGTQPNCIFYQNVYGASNGNGVDGLFLWGAQIEPGTLGKYTPTTSSAVIGENQLTSSHDYIGNDLLDLDEVSVTNLIASSENFNTWQWSSYPAVRSITSNSGIAPDGTNTASKVTPILANSAYSVEAYAFYPTITRVIYTASIYVKSAGYTRVGIWFTPNGTAAIWELSSATNVRADLALTSNSITNVGNGWYRISASMSFNTSQVSVTPLGSVRFYIIEPGQTSTAAWGSVADGTSGVLFWGAQFEESPTAGKYTKTTGTSRPGFSSNVRLTSDLPDIPVLPAPTLRLDFTTGVLDPKVSLTRASQATRVNSRGLVEVVGNNVARFNYDPMTRRCKGLLLEETRTNILQNGDCSGSVNGVLGGTGLLPTYWGMAQQPSGMSYEVVSSGTEAGIKYIDFRIYGTPSVSNHPLLGLGFIAMSSSTTYTMSAYIKVVAGAPTQISFGFGGGTGGNDGLGIMVPTTTLTRYFGTGATSTGVTNLAPWIHFYTTQGVAYDFTVRIGYVQLESGPGATSYIPTISGPVARDADYCLLTTSGWLKYDVGTVISKFDGGLDSTQNGYGRVISPNSAYTILSGNGSFSNSGAWAGVGGLGVTTARTSWQDKALAGTAWDSTVIITAASGNLGTSSSYLPLAWSNTTWTLGGNAGARSNMLNGHIESIDYYPVRLSNTVLTSMTASYKVIGSGSTNQMQAEVTDLRPGSLNLVCNSEFLGANGNTFPTNWNHNGNPSNVVLGVTVTFRRGSYQGYEGLFVTYSGTATGTGEIALSNMDIYPGLTWNAIVTTPCPIAVRIYAAKVSGSGSTVNQHFAAISRNKFGVLTGENVGNYDLVSGGTTVTEYSSGYATFSNPASEVLGFKLNYLVTSGEVVNTTMFYSRPQITIGPMTSYVSTAPGERTYGKISSPTIARKSEISDLVKLITSQVTYIVELVKSFVSLKRFSKNRNVPTLGVAKAAQVLQAEHVKSMFNSRTRPTYDTEARLTPTYSHTPEPSQFTRPTQDTQFESPAKSFIFNKEP